MGQEWRRRVLCCRLVYTMPACMHLVVAGSSSSRRCSSSNSLVLAIGKDTKHVAVRDPQRCSSSNSSNSLVGVVGVVVVIV